MRRTLGTVLACSLAVALATPVARAGANAQPRLAPPSAPAADIPLTPADTLAPNWALVLSGGIARGFAHAGIIRALEEAHVRPSLVVGSSMGGLVGAMYCAGYSPDSVRKILATIPWDVVFSGIPTFAQWRSQWPAPWLEVVLGSAGHLQIPAALVDNTVINLVLVELFLNADAAAQGNFDRLPVPFRAVGTDVRTGRWVLLDHGSLARACRITCGLPLMFAPVEEGNALLVDGGMSSNLPITPARAAGARRVLAVDVALPYPELDESSSGLVVFMQLWDILNKRGQSDTVSVAAGDTLVWLRIPHSGAADFAGGPMIMDEGYAEAGAAVKSWARRSGLPRSDRPLEAPLPHLPRLGSTITWHSRDPVRRAKIGEAVLGKLPSEDFHPMDLRPALRRLALSGLFESAWPTLTNHGDSTSLSFEVRERPVIALGPALAVGNDEGARFHLGLKYRPTQGPLPSLVKVGATWRSLGNTLHWSFEPYALDYGATGWFVRGRVQSLETRVFEADQEITRMNTRRNEAFLGGQLGIALRQSFQAGAGWGSVRTSEHDWNGWLVALRTQGAGRSERTLDAEWAAGNGGYSRIFMALDQGFHVGELLITPGARAGGARGEVPADALVGLGGPHSLSGLHNDQWLGRRMWQGSLELALEAAHQAQLYVAGQVGRVEEPVSGADLGPGAIGGFGIGAEVGLPIGPVRLEWGITDGGRKRVDFLLGTRF